MANAHSSSPPKHRNPKSIHPYRYHLGCEAPTNRPFLARIGLAGDERRPGCYPARTLQSEAALPSLSKGPTTIQRVTKPRSRNVCSAGSPNHRAAHACTQLSTSRVVSQGFWLAFVFCSENQGRFDLTRIGVPPKPPNSQKGLTYPASSLLPRWRSSCAWTSRSSGVCPSVKLQMQLGACPTRHTQVQERKRDGSTPRSAAEPGAERGRCGDTAVEVLVLSNPGLDGQLAERQRGSAAFSLSPKPARTVSPRAEGCCSCSFNAPHPSKPSGARRSTRGTSP